MSEALILESVEVQLSGKSVTASFQVPAGRCIGLMGPTGIGKTTLLRAIAGLGALRYGRIFPTVRKVGFAFQSPVFLGGMTVEEELKMGLRRASDFEDVITGCELTGMAQRYPDRLSGGERQRANLARALLTAQDALLLDEPFSAQDEECKARLRAYLQRWIRDRRVPTLVVTHDRRELEGIADEILCFEPRTGWTGSVTGAI